ncbi:adhesion G-protein coupled receptor G2-like [Sycon ciliatum]|uniref:adhesion G-protein coupled receptor G2-like n=1 Tax=Sycon ciliatum TaxID=27933 RepID=UPI0031F62D9E
MEGASISHLPPGIFSNLTTLSELYLHNNSLSFLPDGVFVDLIQLSILHLGRNSLSALEVGVFESLHNLRSLHLGRNILSSLQVGLFDKLHNLETLHLGRNILSSLQVGLFDKLHNLDRLHLEHNLLSALPVGLFENLYNLTSLNLNGQKFLSLPVGMFDNLSNLENLLILTQFSSYTQACPLVKLAGRTDQTPSPLYGGYGSRTQQYVLQIRAKCRGADVRCYGYGESVDFMCTCPERMLFNGTACVPRATCPTCITYPMCRGSNTEYTCHCSGSRPSEQSASGCGQARFPCSRSDTFFQSVNTLCRSTTGFVSTSQTPATTSTPTRQHTTWVAITSKPARQYTTWIAITSSTSQPARQYTTWIPDISLNQLAKIRVNASDPQQVGDTAVQLQALTSNSPALTEGDIGHAGEIVDQLAAAIKDSQTTSISATLKVQILNNILSAVDSIMKVKPGKIGPKIGIRLAQTLESVATSYSAGGAKRETDGVFLKIVEEDISMLVSCPAETDHAQVFAHLEDSNDVYIGSTANVTNIPEMSTLHVILPPSALKAAPSHSTPQATLSHCQVQQTSFILYKSAILFQDDGLANETRVASAVVSANLGSTETDHLSEDPVTLTFPLSNELADTGFSPTCVYWNYERGGWSTDGCYLARKVMNGASITVQCKCTHLTNFAVLMSRDAISTPNKALSIITYMGCALSAIALSAAMVTIASFRTMRARRHNRIVFLLCTDLLLAIAFFVFGITATSNQAACTFVALFLHFLFLLMFALTSLEAVMLYKQLVDVFGGLSDVTTRILLLLTFGLPLFIVGMAGGITRLRAHGNSKYCWITKDAVFYGSFIAPMCVSLVFNIVVLVRVVVSLHERGSNVASAITTKHTSGVQYLLRVVVFLSILLGVSWLFGALVAVYDHLALQYIFAITNTLQGLGIFVHVSRDAEVRSAWRNSIMSVLSHVSIASHASSKSSQAAPVQLREGRNAAAAIKSLRRESSAHVEQASRSDASDGGEAGGGLHTQVILSEQSESACYTLKETSDVAASHAELL